MPNLPVENTARVKLAVRHNDQLCLNIFHVRGAGVWTASQLEDLNRVVMDWWDNTLKPFVASTTLLDYVESQDLSLEAGEYDITRCDVDCAGTSASPPMPGNVTVVIKYSTGFAGRSYRGRQYHIGLTEAMCVGNQLVAGQSALLAAAYNQLRIDLNTEDPTWDLVIVSRYHDGVERTVPVTTPVSSVTVNNDLDSQRRRLHGRGQ